MIVTVTPNPSLDRTYRIDELRPGTLHRAGFVTVEASGKGVNVSRVLAALGVPTMAVVPVGGSEGRDLAAHLDSAGLCHRVVGVTGAARVNITVIEPGGRTTKINAPGAPLTAAEQRALVRRTGDAARSGATSWVAVCGSLPPDTDPDLVARLVEAAHAAGARAAVDTSGPALPAALSAGADLVKPNREELAELTGRDLGTVGAVVSAARDVASGGTIVLASIGAEGAVLVDGDACLWATPPPIGPVNTTGAGDTLLAGYLAAASEGGAGPEGRLAAAVALGTSACLVHGTAELPDLLLSPADVAVRRATGAGAASDSGNSIDHAAAGTAAEKTRRSS
ncbi:1-phosphofructokinase family hexose kinase [Actinomadura chibensis]|uniref:1-phosphofructokinase family hexose kinase n=1 Tax=Actinomadura chibensis TaxID=392828 RepID=A0A5D0NM92_9ACTN|nr:1-phosphofructokinase family hexose kinase [Actinomadura chibensis]TYB45587.1 1-phosphofructokinase family hexose kinase [Actinomadura chibensis]